MEGGEPGSKYVITSAILSRGTRASRKRQDMAFNYMICAYNGSQGSLPIYPVFRTLDSIFCYMNADSAVWSSTFITTKDLVLIEDETPKQDLSSSVT